ncbi:hypothetical protein SCHPADRAFT_283330 [Schizopora paradoxa]|uniref:Uncharacterized protein n=1 Tax=Schizopora paradoxa TaxID=27342 RepID=A0A0H2RZW7_9AGAM|nr:hypothetical protein SCHPADRAFT_283330 [Schizopora paradoxa]
MGWRRFERRKGPADPSNALSMELPSRRDNIRLRRPPHSPSSRIWSKDRHVNAHRLRLAAINSISIHVIGGAMAYVRIIESPGREKPRSKRTVIAHSAFRWEEGHAGSCILSLGQRGPRPSFDAACSWVWRDKSATKTSFRVELVVVVVVEGRERRKQARRRTEGALLCQLQKRKSSFEGTGICKFLSFFPSFMTMFNVSLIYGHDNVCVACRGNKLWKM